MPDKKLVRAVGHIVYQAVFDESFRNRLDNEDDDLSDHKAFTYVSDHRPNLLPELRKMGREIGKVKIQDLPDKIHGWIPTDVLFGWDIVRPPIDPYDPFMAGPDDPD